MIVVRDAVYGCIWDFRSSRTLSVFGMPGSGKTVLARHIVKAWIEHGGIVLVGSHNSDYSDLADLIHLDTVENVVGYARTLETVYSEDNVLIVVDDWSALSDEDMAYLDSKPESNISWVIIRQRPRSHHFFDNIGMGPLNHASAALGFGPDHDIEDMQAIRRGTATRLSVTGAAQLVVPSEATEPMRDSGLYTRQPLPALPRRLWYVGDAVSTHPRELV